MCPWNKGEQRHPRKPTHLLSSTIFEMHFSISVATATLALTASAAPTEQHSARAGALSGSATGSLFRFGDATACRQVLGQSDTCGSTFLATDKVKSRDNGGELAPHGADLIHEVTVKSRDNGGELDPHGGDLIHGRTFDLKSRDGGELDPHGADLFSKGAVGSSLPLVTFPASIFGQAQTDGLCTQIVTLTYNGVTQQAIVADENTGDEQSIGMCLDLWEAFGGHDNDSSPITNVSWSIVA